MDLLYRIKEILSNDKNIEFAYLFGSYAKGEADINSDIDIALYLKKDDFNTKLSIHHKLQKLLKKDIDLVILNRIKNFDLLKDIFNEGIVVKDSQNDKRVLFELKKDHEMKDYIIFKRVYGVA